MESTTGRKMENINVSERQSRQAIGSHHIKKSKASQERRQKEAIR